LGYPGRYTGDYPTIIPTQTPGRYLVATSDGRIHGETDAVGAFQLVLAELSD
jgi:hypothetical protein